MCMASPGRQLMHAELKIRDLFVFLSDEMPDMAVNRRTL
jgi:uncharacterized glyoxalase superfamily protein PhnB